MSRKTASGKMAEAQSVAEAENQSVQSSKLVPLVVTTSHKGVFFGWGTPTTSSEIRLENAQMCVYWCEKVHGVLGLAATGPVKGCKISPPIPAITLRDVTSVMEASEEAVKAWETQTWA